MSDTGKKNEIFLIGELTRDDRDTRDADIQLTTYEISAQAAWEALLCLKDFTNSISINFWYRLHVYFPGMSLQKIKEGFCNWTW